MPSAKAQAAEPWLERELAQGLAWPPQAARSTVSVAALLGHRAHASAAVPARGAAIPERPFPAAQAAAQARLVLPAASARWAEAAAGVATQHEAVPQPEELAGAAARDGAVPQPEERAEAAAQHEAVPRPAEAALVAVVGLLPEVAEAEPGAAAEPLPAAAALGAAAELQPEAVVEAERDGAVQPRAVEPGAVGLRQAVVPSVPPSASVCRPGRLRPRARPPALRPVARFARGRRSSQSAAPKWRWWQAAQDEV